MNGDGERFTGTQGGAIRATLVEADNVLWPYAAKYVGYLWSRIPRRYSRLQVAGGLTPLEVRNMVRDGAINNLLRKNEPAIPEEDVKEEDDPYGTGGEADTLLAHFLASLASPSPEAQE